MGFYWICYWSLLNYDDLQHYRLLLSNVGKKVKQKSSIPLY